MINTIKSGTVYLVGAGPGDPELMTIKGRRLIGACDAIVYDYLVSDAILQWVRPICEKYYVGKKAGFHALPQEEIEALLIRLAQEGKSVVRLKGGDPFIFGRGGEEAEALRKKEIPYEVIPAVTAALGCAAYCGIPLTHREYSSAVTFISGHEKPGKEVSHVNWDEHAKSGATLVLYMAMGRLDEICHKLITAGRPASTPVAVVEWGTTPKQRNVQATLDTIVHTVQEAEIAAPAIVIIGNVASLGKNLHWFDPQI